MSALPVYDQLSRKHLGFDYDVKSKQEILAAIDLEITKAEASLTTADKKTTDITEVKTESEKNKIIDAGDEIQKLLFKTGLGTGTGSIFDEMSRNTKINIEAMSKHVEKVATYAFLCQLKEHIDKHDNTGKYLSPLMFFDFQRLRKDKEMRKALKVSEHAYPDVFYDKDTDTEETIQGASDGSEMYSMINYRTKRLIGRKKISENLFLFHYGDELFDINEIDTLFLKGGHYMIDLPATTRAFGFSKDSSSPIVDAWVQRFVGLAIRTSEKVTPTPRPPKDDEIIVDKDDMMIPFPNPVNVEDMDPSETYIYAELPMVKVLKKAVDKAKLVTSSTGDIRLIINSQNIISNIKSALDSVFSYTKQVKEYGETEALRDKIKKRAAQAFKSEGMAYSMVKYLLEMLDSYTTSSSGQFTKQELKAINLALLDATAAFTNVITDSKSIKQEVASKRQKINDVDFSGVTADPDLSAKLAKVIREHGHPVYLEEFLDKEEQDKKVESIKRRSRGPRIVVRGPSSRRSRSRSRGSSPSRGSSSGRTTVVSRSPSVSSKGSSPSRGSSMSRSPSLVARSKSPSVSSKGSSGRRRAPTPNPKMLKRAEILKTKPPTSIPEQFRINMDKRNSMRKGPDPVIKKTAEIMKENQVDSIVQKMLKTYPKYSDVINRKINSDLDELKTAKKIDMDQQNAIKVKWLEKVREKQRSKTQQGRSRRSKSRSSSRSRRRKEQPISKGGRSSPAFLFDDSSSKMDAIDLSDEEFSRLEVPSSGTDFSDTDLSEYSSDSDMEEELHMMPKAMFTQEPPKYEGNYNSSFSKSIYKY